MTLISMLLHPASGRKCSSVSSGDVTNRFSDAVSRTSYRSC